MAKRTLDYGSAKEITVHYSENAEGGTLCVDIFERADGSFGFELFRCDPETGEGWFRLGYHADQQHAKLNDAVQAARGAYGWFTGPEPRAIPDPSQVLDAG